MRVTSSFHTYNTSLHLLPLPFLNGPAAASVAGTGTATQPVPAASPVPTAVPAAVRKPAAAPVAAVPKPATVPFGAGGPNPTAAPVPAAVLAPAAEHGQPACLAPAAQHTKDAELADRVVASSSAQGLATYPACTRTEDGKVSVSVLGTFPLLSLGSV